MVQVAKLNFATLLCPEVTSGAVVNYFTANRFFCRETRDSEQFGASGKVTMVTEDNEGHHEMSLRMVEVDEESHPEWRFCHVGIGVNQPGKMAEQLTLSLRLSNTQPVGRGNVMLRNNALAIELVHSRTNFVVNHAVVMAYPGRGLQLAELLAKVFGFKVYTRRQSTFPGGTAFFLSTTGRNDVLIQVTEPRERPEGDFGWWSLGIGLDDIDEAHLTVHRVSDGAGLSVRDLAITPTQWFAFGFPDITPCPIVVGKR